MKWTILASVLAAIVSLTMFVRSVDAAPGSLSDPLTAAPGPFTVNLGVPGDPVVYDASGAHFGTGLAGDGGRSYQRTNFDRYAQVKSFVAEITFETTSDDQAVFIGMGAGEVALFGTPDWSTQFASASFWPETGGDKFVRFKTNNDINAFGDTLVAGFDPGVHRFRMTWTKATGFLLGAIDLNYAGGPFVADAMVNNFPISANALYGGDPMAVPPVPPTNLTDNYNGWIKGLLSEPSAIFFGGDDGTTFRDLVITTVPEPATGLGLLFVMGALGFWRKGN